MGCRGIHLGARLELDATAVLHAELSGLFHRLGVTSLLDAPLRRTNADCEDGDWRAGGGWRDKSLGMWRLAEIPRG